MPIFPSSRRPVLGTLSSVRWDLHMSWPFSIGQKRHSATEGMQRAKGTAGSYELKEL